MLFVRGILLLIFLLISASIIDSIIFSNKLVDPQDIVALSVFSLFILLLGPFWPTNDRQAKFLNLLRRHPKTSHFVLWMLVAIVSFYFAADAYFHPENQPSRKMRLIFEVFGAQGVSGFWSIVGLFGVIKCLEQKNN